MQDQGRGGGREGRREGREECQKGDKIQEHETFHTLIITLGPTKMKELALAGY